MRTVALSVVSLALAACASAQDRDVQGVVFDDLLSFSDPASCRETPQLSALLESMYAPGDSDSLDLQLGRLVVPPAFDEAIDHVYMQRFDHSFEFVVTTRGTWKGLPLHSIRRAMPEGGDPGGFSFEIGASPDIVEQRLRADGFPVRAGEEVTLGPPDGYEHIMFLSSANTVGDRSHFGCVIF